MLFSALVSKYYLGADYDLTLRDRVGVPGAGQYFNQMLRPAVSFSLYSAGSEPTGM